MADSNLDFGQGKYALDKYLKAHPDVLIVNDNAAGSKFVIGVNDYLNLKNDYKYYWVSKLKPVGQVNHCFLLFDNRPVHK